MNKIIIITLLILSISSVYAYTAPKTMQAPKAMQTMGQQQTSPKTVQKRMDEYQRLDRKCIRYITKYKRKIAVQKSRGEKQNKHLLKFYYERLSYWKDRCRTFNNTNR